MATNENRQVLTYYYISGTTGAQPSDDETGGKRGGFKNCNAPRNIARGSRVARNTQQL